MKSFIIQLTISMILALSTPVTSFAQQSPPSSPTEPMTGMKPDRTTADTATRKSMHEKESALRQKRTDCRKQARQEKISLLKRSAFVSDCIKR